MSFKLKENAMNFSWGLSHNNPKSHYSNNALTNLPYLTYQQIQESILRIEIDIQYYLNIKV